MPRSVEEIRADLQRERGQLVVAAGTLRREVARTRAHLGRRLLTVGAVATAAFVLWRAIIVALDSLLRKMGRTLHSAT